MNVEKMLDLMELLGIGETSDDDDLLDYLNLAHYELYRKTANFNDDVTKFITLQNGENLNNIVLPETPFLISKVVLAGQTVPLKHMSKDDFATYYINNSDATGNPLVFVKEKKTLTFFPSEEGVTYNFAVVYVPEVVDLTQDTQEDDIPYPPSFHDVLVNGGVDYLFNEESGFRSPEKQKSAKEKWEKGKPELISYLQGSNKNKMSTFSSA